MKARTVLAAQFGREALQARPPMTPARHADSPLRASDRLLQGLVKHLRADAERAAPLEDTSRPMTARRRRRARRT